MNTHSNKEQNGHDHSSHKILWGEKTEMIFAVLSGLFLGLGFLLKILEIIPSQIAVIFYLLSYVFGGYYTVKEAYQATVKGKFEIDFLMLFAAVGAGILGEWAEGALLLFLFSLGHALEHYAMNRARKSITALSELAPPTATRLNGEDQEEVPIELLVIGDVILVKPNTKIAADGIVIEGESMVNQASITGESLPVSKTPSDAEGLRFEKIKPEHRVFSGTINGSSPLKVRVMKKAEDSTLSKIVALVNEAEAQKSPTQQFADRFEKYFVPIVLVLVSLLMLAFLVLDESFSESFYRAMAVLVSASPCALAISTPSAVLAGIARAARSGILIKGGRPLENLGNVKAIAFDKTGTLTEGKPKLTVAIPYKKVDLQELLETTAAVEKLSDHPLAAAIVEGAVLQLGHDDFPSAKDLTAITARGVKASLNGDNIYIGNRLLMKETTCAEVPQSIDEEMNKLEVKGQTPMIVYKNQAYLGIVAVMDVERSEAKDTLSKLKKLGIKEMVMLTGDHQSVATAVASKIGIPEARGNMLPEDKVAAIKELTASHKYVAMVGDGVNDAPALAYANVSIAMGAAGSAVALETADIALMADRLDKLPFAIKLSRKTNQIIKQNLWISLGMVAILVPLTISGIASIGPAVVAHEGSTLVVVLNALRLLGVKDEV